MSYYIDGNRFNSLEDAVEHIIKDLPCDRSKILREYTGKLLQEIKQLNKNLAENNSDCGLCYSNNKMLVDMAKIIMVSIVDWNRIIGPCCPSHIMNEIEQFLKQV